MRRKPIALLIFCAFFFPGVALAEEEEAPRYHVVRPMGESHELLPKTCGVCHKDSPYQFVVVAAPTQAGLDRALKLLAAPEVAALRRLPQNPHKDIACLFCHMEQPVAGAAVADMQFRTLQGSPVAVAEVAQLCQMCHVESAAEHPQVLARGKTAAALAEAGLPVFDGQVVCSTCHDMHASEVGAADLRLAYLPFARTSPLSYVHGNRAACLGCHPTDLAPGSTPVYLDPDPTARCARCHDARHGGIHPMAVAPTEATYPMDFLDFPLDDRGRLSCSTCHDHPCEQRAAERNRPFLREGPYMVITDFCYVCHPKAGLGSLNPHAQVGGEGTLTTTTCAFCHRSIPDPEDPEAAYFDADDLNFLHTPLELCIGCHETTAHPSGINHLVEIDPERLQKLTNYQRRHKVTLPLDDSNRIVCTTCHNPHAKGVLRGEAALGAAEELHWRVPSFAELCTPCHARYD